MTQNEFEDMLEASYWEFDARKKGYNDYNRQSERDAFKAEVRGLLKKMLQLELEQIEKDIGFVK